MDELIVTGERPEFNMTIFKQRGFVRAKYWSWEESRNGLIVYACRDFLKVIFLTGINAASSYFPIKIAEVAAGLWQLTYSPDLETIYTINGAQVDETDLPAGVRRLFERTDFDGDNESGTP